MVIPCGRLIGRQRIGSRDVEVSIMESYGNSRGGNPLPALLLGFGIGVVSTIIYAAAREEKFNRVVKRTQDAGSKIHDTADHWRENIQHAGEKIQEAGSRVKESVKNVVANVRGTAEEAVEDVEQAAKSVRRGNTA